MVKVHCRTNLDLHHCEKWPTELPTIAEGQLIESQTPMSHGGVLQLEVCRIIWKTRTRPNWEGGGSEVYAEVEMHLPKHRFQHITAFEEWYEYQRGGRTMEQYRDRRNRREARERKEKEERDARDLQFSYSLAGRPSDKAQETYRQALHIIRDLDAVIRDINGRSPVDEIRKHLTGGPMQWNDLVTAVQTFKAARPFQFDNLTQNLEPEPAAVVEPPSPVEA